MLYVTLARPQNAHAIHQFCEANKREGLYERDEAQFRDLLKKREVEFFIFREGGPRGRIVAVCFTATRKKEKLAEKEKSGGYETVFSNALKSEDYPFKGQFLQIMLAVCVANKVAGEKLHLRSPHNSHHRHWQPEFIAGVLKSNFKVAKAFHKLGLRTTKREPIGDSGEEALTLHMTVEAGLNFLSKFDQYLSGPSPMLTLARNLACNSAEGKARITATQNSAGVNSPTPPAPAVS